MVRTIWKLTAENLINNKIPLKLYESQRSSLRVALADVQGPMVHGTLSFATETCTNDGLPHTLEHLVFMGSKTYPYKGILDVVANRCLASGTNASTDQDNTYYTLTTVGSKGFLKVLPVYLDHLLEPTLTTEVHHIDGEGNDAGVVYSEMQDHESEMESMIADKLKELLYPEGSAYRVNTGGRLIDLRESCSNEKVRAYHFKNYHLKNLLITVCGRFDHSELLKAIEPVEERNLRLIPSQFDRPFSTQNVPPILEPKVARIRCPADDETVGVVELAWLAFPASDVYSHVASLVLFDYLTETAVAPLKKDFVQIDDPYCSSVYLSLTEQTTCQITLSFSGVPVAKLSDVKNRFFNKTFADHSKFDAFDMERMGFIIDQQIKRYKSKLENNPNSKISNAMIGYQLYGSDADLAARLNEVDLLQKLKAEPAKFWFDLFKQIFTTKYVCVEGEPSSDAVNEISSKEEQRIADQIKNFGKDGLKLCASNLESSIKANTVNKPDDEVLRDLIVKEFENFSMIEVQTVNNLMPQIDVKHSDFIKKFPLLTVLHKVPSDFVDANILIDTFALPARDRCFLMLWFETMFQSSAIIDGVELSYEEVAKLSTKDLVSNGVTVGISGLYDRYISLRLRVDTNGIKNLPKWAKIYLQGTLFEPARISICAKKLVKYAADYKRDGSSMASFLSTYLSYKSESNNRIYSSLSLEHFHSAIAKAIDESKNADAIVKRLQEVRQNVLSCPIQLQYAKVTLTDDTDWNFTDTLKYCTSSKPFQCEPGHDTDWRNMGRSFAIPVGGTDSSFLLQKTNFDGNWHSPSIMHTLLLTQYLTQCEGPLWNAVRGKGLAYGANIYVMPDRELIILSLYRCSQISTAYNEAKAIVFDTLNSSTLDAAQFEAAKRSLVSDLIGSQASVKATAQAALLGTIRNIDPLFILDLCSQIWHAETTDVLKVARPALLQLFDDQKIIRSIAVNPSRLKELKSSFPTIEEVSLGKIQLDPYTFNGENLF